MQAMYAYEPGTVEKSELTFVERAHFTVTVLANGVPVPFPKHFAGKIEGEKVVLKMGYSSVNMSNGKLVINIGSWGIQETCYFEKELVAVKDELPSLCAKLTDWFEPLPKKDLITGLPVKTVFSIEYAFVDEHEKTVVTEKEIPAKVFFNTLYVPRKTISVRQEDRELCFATGLQGVSGKKWTIDRTGWIQVPSKLNWTPEQIEQAFKALASEFLNLQPEEIVKTWRFKQELQYCLE